MNFEQKLKKYAEVIIQMGVNLQPGQRLIISAPLEAVFLVRLLVELAYKRKCRLVDVFWRDEQLALIRFKNAPRDSFKEYPTWKTDALVEVMKKGGAILSILGDDPDLLKDQDHKLITTAQRVAHLEAKKYREYTMKNKVNWCITSAAGKAWAAKVFPQLAKAKQVPALWDKIFSTSRIHNNSVAVWKEHVKKLSKISKYLNKKQYFALHFSAPGTDLIVGLPQNHIWGCAATQTTAKKPIKFVPNIPTEEIFTMPHKDKVNGTVTASKPLYYAANRLSGFSFTFKDGKVTEIKGKERDKKILKEMIATDKGAARLGEVALVAHSSPISQSNLLFCETLFDENAASHLALGQSFQHCLVNGLKMSDKAYAKAGGNLSLVHTDFMVGSDKMDVDGIKKNGTKEAVMRSGEWAFLK